ncbi:DNA-binding MarR family transcriptional regulator [Agromyces flavus]|uniref:DNA-binding MarR family transcriptional regulator n=1 Tax=Agromyces flavus TaxID=589382 RepID=A0A1H1WX54_9MICO|nr:MarR family transcriptional regulator [Agromyces flavus]MCP2366276.1 DNA-binding MarR family transcriptional regulator [Agromyces flavus]GGI44350.1 MarR family transcriptional regulator [Agromyces flavus]SDT01602.1 DNA-binding transcriptional regulator, MarR family [Agromyces flavus]
MSSAEEPLLEADDWTFFDGFVGMHFELARELDRRLQDDVGISQPDYGVLLTLFRTPERRLRPGALGEMMGWEKSRVSHHLTRMASRGLIERIECDTDGRGSLIVMTRLGRLAFLRATREHGRDIRTLFLDVLEPDERRAIADASARVRARIRELREAAAG